MEKSLVKWAPGIPRSEVWVNHTQNNMGHISTVGKNWIIYALHIINITRAYFEDANVFLNSRSECWVLIGRSEVHVLKAPSAMFACISRALIDSNIWARQKETC